MYVPKTPVHQLLERLRGRIRRTWAMRGAALVLVAVCAVAVVSFAMDYALELPLAVRWIHLAVVAVCVGIVAWGTLLRPLKTDMDESDLAQAVEHGVPTLRDRLISALDFEQRLDDPDEPESKPMMRAVIKDAEAMASRVDEATLVDSRPAMRALAGGGLAVIVLVTVAAAFPSDFGHWLRRGVLLEDVEWPRRTNIRVLDFPHPEPLVITRGDDLRIVAEVDGAVPRELELHFEELGDPEEEGDTPEVVYRETRKIFPVEGEPNRFAHDLRAVPASFRFWVTGGDDLDRHPVYYVDAVIPPRIASITAEVTYPEYTGLEAEVKRVPTIEVLAGSRVDLTLVANMRLASARLVPLESEGEGGGVQPPRDLAVSGDGGDTLVVGFEVKDTVQFHLELHAEAGHANRAEDDVFHITAVEDRPPDVRLLFPETRRFRTPNGILPVKAVIGDDFGVRDVVLELRREDGSVHSATVWPKPGEEPDDRSRVDLYAPVDLATLGGPDDGGLQPDDVLYLVLRTADTTGNTRDTSEVAIEIVSSDALEQRQAQEQTRLREALGRLRRNSDRVLRSIRDLRAAVEKAAPDRKEFETGRDLQVDQGRVTNELTRFLDGIHRVLNAYVYNRLQNVPTVERLLPIYDEFLSKPVENADGVFPRALYAKIVDEKRADRLYDPEILGALFEIMDLGQTAELKTSPGVYESLREWGDDTGHAAEHLDLAYETAQALEHQLRLIDERMQRWEALNEIIEALRAIRETQIKLGEKPPAVAPDPEDR